MHVRRDLADPLQVQGGQENTALLRTYLKIAMALPDGSAPLRLISGRLNLNTADKEDHTKGGILDEALLNAFLARRGTLVN